MSILRTTALAAFLLAAPAAQALDLDWSGQFRAENHFVSGYTLDANNRLPDAARAGAGGYYIPGGGSTNASFQTLFLRLQPKVVVNDNVYLKSEWWAGDPIFGMFGNSVPYTTDQRQFYSNQSRGSFITAQRFWGEFLSDVGTVQVGRAPLNWGLGVVWNKGDGVWDRYQSTGDTIRLVSKFGSFSFVPGYVKYSMGNNVGGACNAGAGGCTPILGVGNVADITVAFLYENPDEDFEGGVNFIRRLASGSQDPNAGFLGVGPVGAQPVTGMNFNIWDLYGRKKWGKFSVAGEAPIVSGDINGIPYSTFAAALEGSVKFSETWEASARAGRAPGQPNMNGNSPDSFKAFYFHPNYRLGLIMFNYQLANFAGPNTLNNPATSAASLRSPYDNPIVNANYLKLGGLLHADKWHFNLDFITASAQYAAGGTNFYNTRDRRFNTLTAGATPQSKSIGSEFDLGAAFQWDESFQFRTDLGLFLPGDYWKFTNVAGVQNATDSVFALKVGVGVTF